MGWLRGCQTGQRVREGLANGWGGEQNIPAWPPQVLLLAFLWLYSPKSVNTVDKVAQRVRYPRRRKVPLKPMVLLGEACGSFD